MWAHRFLLAVTITGGVAADAPAQRAPSGASRGAAVVRFVIEPPGTTGTFHFRGTPAGATTGGGSLLASGLAPGRYRSTLADPGPELRLTAITCDDHGSHEPSVGDVVARSVTFHLDPGETVACVFTLTPRTPAGADRAALARPAGAATGVNPFRSQDPLLDDFPVPGDVPPTAGTFQLPRTGLWNATSAEGTMVCLGATYPLDPSRAAGIIEVLADGRALRATGFGYMAPLAMAPDPQVTGRYTGSTPGFQGRIPVTIGLHWQLVTDEWIIGYLESPASDGACSMFQTFQLEYADRSERGGVNR
jgi:hypothetical protein